MNDYDNNQDNNENNKHYDYYWNRYYNEYDKNFERRSMKLNENIYYFNNIIDDSLNSYNFHGKTLIYKITKKYIIVQFLSVFSSQNLNNFPKTVHKNGIELLPWISDVVFHDLQCYSCPDPTFQCKYQ